MVYIIKLPMAERYERQIGLILKFLTMSRCTSCICKANVNISKPLSKEEKSTSD